MYEIKATHLATDRVFTGISPTLPSNGERFFMYTNEAVHDDYRYLFFKNPDVEQVNENEFLVINDGIAWSIKYVESNSESPGSDSLNIVGSSRNVAWGIPNPARSEGAVSSSSYWM